MRAFHGDDRKEIDVAAHLGDLDDCGKSRQPAAYHDDVWRGCHELILSRSAARLRPRELHPGP